jgi:lipopolysaccharide transport system permease protein
MGFFLSLLTGVFRDTVNIVTLLTTFLLFLIPVLYPAPESGLFVAVNKWNPLSHLIIACRDIVFIGKFSNPAGFWGSTLFSLLIFVSFWRFFHIVEPKIAERI